MSQHLCTTSSSTQQINDHKRIANQYAQANSESNNSSRHELKQNKHKANPARPANSKSKRSLAQRDQGTANERGQAHSIPQRSSAQQMEEVKRTANGRGHKRNCLCLYRVCRRSVSAKYLLRYEWRADSIAVTGVTHRLRSFTISS